MTAIPLKSIEGCLVAKKTREYPNTIEAGIIKAVDMAFNQAITQQGEVKDHFKQG